MHRCHQSQDFCNKIMDGNDSDPIDIDEQSRWDMMFSHLLAGSGYLNTIHFGQLVGHEDSWFGRFDYGKEKNIEKYGQATPPSYDMSLINYPIATMFGSDDMLVSAPDREWT